VHRTQAAVGTEVVHDLVNLDDGRAVVQNIQSAARRETRAMRAAAHGDRRARRA
jgi:hypothetical protein